jgi:hypothetical protein
MHEYMAHCTTLHTAPWDCRCCACMTHGLHAGVSLESTSSSDETQDATTGLQLITLARALNTTTTTPSRGGRDHHHAHARAQVCDKLAEGGFTVVLADSVRGDAWQLSNFPPSDQDEFMAWIGKHDFERVMRPDMTTLSSHLSGVKVRVACTRAAPSGSGRMQVAAAAVAAPRPLERRQPSSGCSGGNGGGGGGSAAANVAAAADAA